MDISHTLGTLLRRASPVSLNGVLSKLGLGEYFRYHGIYSPGVRLLRSLSIPQKVSVVALCFLVPMGLLGHGFLKEILDRRAQTRLELTGAEYARRVLNLSMGLQVQRQQELLGPVAGAAGPTADASWQALLSAEAAHGDALRSSGYVQEVQQALQRLQAAPPANRSERLARYGDAIAALHTLSRHVMDQSRLGAEPNLVINDLADLGLDQLPNLVERLASTRSVAGLMLRGQSDLQTTHSLVRQLAVTEEALGTIIRRFDLARHHDADRIAPLDPAGRLASVSAFLELSRRELFQAQPTVDPARYLAEGHTAEKAAHALQVLSMEEVVRALKLRAGDIDARLTLMVWSVLACVALAVYLLLAFYRVMNGGLGLLQQQVSRMAEGDLSARPRPWGSDEVARALASLGDSLAKLADLFAAVKQGVAAISHASTAIAEGTSDLSARTDESVAGVSEILRGVESYVEQLEQAGRRVDAAVEAVHALRLDSTRSRHHMERLEERMQSLRGKSKQISEIVELIDHIAFRTNILALNASVEASKAGEAGRSFAVVAQEVRSLAARSAAAARRINTIVTGSTDDIEQSGALVEQAATSLAETDGHVARIHESMTDIVTLTRSGQQNSQEILNEIRGVNELSGRNLKLVEQMARAADDLSRQGDRLNDKVRGFKLS